MLTGVGLQLSAHLVVETVEGVAPREEVQGAHIATEERQGVGMTLHYQVGRGCCCCSLLQLSCDWNTLGMKTSKD